MKLHLFISLVLSLGPAFCLADDYDWKSKFSQSDVLKAFSDVIQNNTQKGQTLSFSTFAAKNPKSGDLLIIESVYPVNPSFYKSKEMENIQIFMSQFQERRTPYSGSLTLKYTCPKEYLPKQKRDWAKETGAKVFAAYANLRNTFGACNKDEAKKAAVYAILYRKKTSEMIQLKFFSHDLTLNNHLITSIINEVSN